MISFAESKHAKIPPYKPFRMPPIHADNVADPGRRDIQVIPERAKNGRKENIILHTIATDPTFDDLLEELLRFQ